jgi:hypothetical protein
VSVWRARIRLGEHDACAEDWQNYRVGEYAPAENAMVAAYSQALSLGWAIESERVRDRGFPTRDDGLKQGGSE